MTEQTYIGIDYGNGISNRDPNTGIRYGAISLRSISCAFLSDFEIVYYDEDQEDSEIKGFSYDQEGYSLWYSPDSSFLWVFKSPITTHCAFCSPCVPGAGDLDNPNKHGVITYALAPDMMEKEV